MSGAPEFSRRVPLSRLGPEPFRQEIAASEEERRALARRFELASLDRLCATVELVRRGERLIMLDAAFEAEFVQNCVVTLEPVPGSLSERFALLYGPADGEEEAAMEAGEEVAFEPLAGAAIDIGEAVAQEFSLALPPFPRSPGVVVGCESPAADHGPFAVLARLVDGSEG
jgi:uncharacterized metal-binding protein YceD (DUF177 family)